MLNGVSQLQQVRFEGYMDQQDQMEHAQNTAENRHNKAVDESYDEAMREIDANRRAREKKSFWTMLGAIFLGPIIGSAIGNAIGGAAASGDEKESEAAKRKTALADQQVEESWDQVKDMQEDIDAKMDQAAKISKVSMQLDEIGYIGTDS